MQTSQQSVAVHRQHAASARILMPVFMIGVMMIIAFAAAFSSDGREGLVRQIVAALPGNDSRSAFGATLRPYRDLDTTASALIIQPIDEASSNGFQQLQNPDALTKLERTTVEIKLATPGSEHSASRISDMELAQLLSRRMNSLGLRATLRVSSPELLPQVTAMAQAMITDGALTTDQLAIALDPKITSNMLQIELLRPVRLTLKSEAGL